MGIEEKGCAGCNNKLTPDHFHKNRKSPDGLCRLCKDCTRSYQRKWREINAAEISERRRNRPEEQKDKDRRRAKIWAEEHPEEKKRFDSEYRGTHKDEKRNRHAYRMETDTQYKLACSLRWRMNRAIRASSKSGSAVSDLGCSIEELKNHLESNFKDGMSWDSWGKGAGKWHIDHILPLVSFDLTQRDQFLLACNFKNLQPLWEEDNIRKGSRL